MGSGFGQNGSTLKRGALLGSFATACFSGLHRPSPISNAETTAPRYTKRHLFMATSLSNGNVGAPRISLAKERPGDSTFKSQRVTEVPSLQVETCAIAMGLQSPSAHSFPSAPIGPRCGL